MKRFLIMLIATLIVAGVCAQPAKRRTMKDVDTKTKDSAQGAASKKSTSTTTKGDRATLLFPTSAEMPEDVVWRRDIYRQLDLLEDANAPLYYPVEPRGKEQNLFTYLFRLMLTGRISAYTYKLDGVESFDEKDKLAVKDVLDRYGIY